MIDESTRVDPHLLGPPSGRKEKVRLEGWSYWRDGPKWRPGLDGITLSMKVIDTYMVLAFIIHYGGIYPL